MFAVDVYDAGLMSVFGQNLENVSQTLTVLRATANNQYGIRGQPCFDKVTFTFLLSSICDQAANDENVDVVSIIICC